MTSHSLRDQDESIALKIFYSWLRERERERYESFKDSDFLKCILRDSIRHPRLAVKIARERDNTGNKVKEEHTLGFDISTLKCGADS